LNKFKRRNNQWREAERGLEPVGRLVKAPTLPPSLRARVRAREEAGNQRPWPADKVERWSIDRLIPYARNARTHSDEQVAQIAASIREFGFTNPVLVDEAGTLIAGHGRVLGAQRGCSGGIGSSAATARSRRTSSACSAASSRTLWSPTRPTA
jgi:hypothetical protein